VYTGPEANGRANPTVDLHRPLGVGETRRLTDMGNAERFADHHKRHARYCYAWGTWLIYDGKRWAVDDDGNAEQLMQETVRNIYNEAARETDDVRRRDLVNHAKRSEARARIADALHLARPFLSVRPEELDADPMLLNCENGTVDLRTGRLREHDIEDMLTKIAAPCDDLLAQPPVFNAFLAKILPASELRQFVQAAIGYAAIGENTEEVLPIFHGHGANGKSTLINAVMEALGNYGMQAAPDLLLAKHGAHPTELADLFGARFVASVETDDGRRLNEGLVKQLTGRDKIKARRMREDFWQFNPTHTVFLATNHKPEVRGTDHAIWRRLKLVPFDVTIPDEEQDKKLPEKLREELPAILSWIVRGALMYQKIGLPEPDEVRGATASYRSDMDVLAAFIEDRCVVAENAHAAATPIYHAFKEWCVAKGEGDGGSQRRFGARLKERGFESFTYTAGPHRDRKGWRGIGLRDDRHDDPERGSERSARADEQIRANGSNPAHEANKATESADKGPQSGQTADDRPHTESRIGMEKTPDFADSAEDHGPKSGINSPMGIREEVMPKKGPQGPHRPQPAAVTPREGRLSAKQTERVKRLIAEGMAPEWARAEVLGVAVAGD
jgi:putative DNA primase/helicase